MSTVTKFAALNNLEGLYGEAVSYIDSITHSDIYYDESTCDSTFFSSITDGAGSGLICATLDGYTADEIISAGSPSGVIGIWSGSEASIPAGWKLADGIQNSPGPDLRGRVVVGAGGHYVKGATGGADTITATATITIAGHALTAAEIPLHTHSGIVDYYAIASQSGGGNQPYNARTAIYENRYTEYAGSGTAHDHTATFVGTSDQDKRQPYYALCFIQKS